MVAVLHFVLCIFSMVVYFFICIFIQFFSSLFCVNTCSFIDHIIFLFGFFGVTFDTISQFLFETVSVPIQTPPRCKPTNLKTFTYLLTISLVAMEIMQICTHVNNTIHSDSKIVHYVATIVALMLYVCVYTIMTYSVYTVITLPLLLF